jgi:hypothetical protein
MNINLDDLKKTHGDQALAIFKQVAEISGAGDPGENHIGGIDITGLSEAKKAQIARLVEKADDSKRKVKNNGRNSLKFSINWPRTWPWIAVGRLGGSGRERKIDASHRGFQRVHYPGCDR